MKNKRTWPIIAFLLIIGLSCLHAQQAVLTASGNITGSNGSVTYSVGQVAILTNMGTNGIITEGVQQPFEILIMEGIEEKGITLECSIFPNPAGDFVQLKIDKHEIKTLSYRLYTLTGVLLQNNMIGSSEISIPMDGLVPSTYFLTVTENDNVLKSFKIIKK